MKIERIVDNHRGQRALCIIEDEKIQAVFTLDVEKYDGSISSVYDPRKKIYKRHEDHLKVLSFLSEDDYNFIYETCYLVHPEYNILKTIDGTLTDLNFNELPTVINQSGYTQVSYKGKFLSAHRLTHQMVNYSMDDTNNVVDHLDGIRENHSASNLSSISKSLNGRNRLKSRKSFKVYESHNFRGVHQKEIGGKFYTQINTTKVNELYKRCLEENDTNKKIVYEFRCFKRFLNQNRELRGGIGKYPDSLAVTIDVFKDGSKVIPAYVYDYIIYSLYGDKIKTNYDLQCHCMDVFQMKFMCEINDEIEKWGNSIKDYIIENPSASVCTY